MRPPGTWNRIGHQIVTLILINVDILLNFQPVPSDGDSIAANERDVVKLRVVAQPGEVGEEVLGGGHEARGQGHVRGHLSFQAFTRHGCNMSILKGSY